MGKAPSRFRQADLEKIVKTLEKAGKHAYRIAIDPSGSITVDVAAEGGERPSSMLERLTDEQIRLRSKPGC